MEQCQRTDICSWMFILLRRDTGRNYEARNYKGRNYEGKDYV